MLYFNLFPDFKILSKDYQFNESPETLHQQYSDGFAISIDWYYTDEMVAAIEEGFKTILEKYKLSDHYHNLMYLSLGKQQLNEAILDSIVSESIYAHRVKELAGIFLAYNGNKEKPVNLELKLNDNIYKVKDQILSRWIGNLITDAVKRGSYRINDFGITPDRAFFDKIDNKNVINIEKIKTVFQTKLTATEILAKKKSNAFKAELCFYILPYLNNQTHLKKSIGTNFSDLQLSFLYELMILFQLFPNRTFDHNPDYEPKDFMRNFLVKYAKTYAKTRKPN